MTAAGGAIRGIGARLPRLRPLKRTGARRRAELGVAAATAQWALVSLAALALWLVAFGLGASALIEHHQQHDLYNRFRQNLADAVAPVGGAIKRDVPVAMFDAPSGGLHDLVAVEGSSSSDLRGGPGHYPGSVLPGQAGVSIFLGRATGFGGPFGDILAFHVGDKIVATTGQGQFTYSVLAVSGPGDPIPAFVSGQSRLLLVTSEGSGWRTGWAPTHAVYVHAVLQGKTVPRPNSVGTPRASDKPMKSDTSGLTGLLLWMQLLVIAAIGVVIGRARWGSWQTWLVGVPVVLTALWGVSQSAWVLLPNLV